MGEDAQGTPSSHHGETSTVLSHAISYRCIRLPPQGRGRAGSLRSSASLNRALVALKAAMVPRTFAFPSLMRTLQAYAWLPAAAWKVQMSLVVRMAKENHSWGYDRAIKEAAEA